MVISSLDSGIGSVLLCLLRFKYLSWLNFFSAACLIIAIGSTACARDESWFLNLFIGVGSTVKSVLVLM